MLPNHQKFVILSAAKNPRICFLLLPLSVLLHTAWETVISTEAAHAFCQQRSGEIRFFTTTMSQPTPRSCLLPPLAEDARAPVRNAKSP
jgi:hypothetical protein